MALRRRRNHLDVVKDAPCLRKEFAEIAVTGKTNSNRGLLHPLVFGCLSQTGRLTDDSLKQNFVAVRGTNQENPDYAESPIALLLTGTAPVTSSDQHSKEEISRFVRDGLAQQLTGILLAAKALTRGLEDRQAIEATEADRLVSLLKAANREVATLLYKLR
jgi:hypothetical protein